MFELSRAVPVNDPSDPDAPTLVRDQVWGGLVMKAENALPFVAKMTRCDVLERKENEILRDIMFRGEPARERVTLYPEELVRFERLSGKTLGTIENRIEEDGEGELQLRFSFALEREGIEPDSQEEREYAKQIEGDYLAAVDATLAAIRRAVAEDKLHEGERSTQ